jgi:hypothetical protein
MPRVSHHFVVGRPIQEVFAANGRPAGVREESRPQPFGIKIKIIPNGCVAPPGKQAVSQALAGGGVSQRNGRERR